MLRLCGTQQPYLMVSIRPWWAQRLFKDHYPGMFQIFRYSCNISGFIKIVNPWSIISLIWVQFHTLFAYVIGWIYWLVPVVAGSHLANKTWTYPFVVKRNHLILGEFKDKVFTKGTNFFGANSFDGIVGKSSIHLRYVVGNDQLLRKVYKGLGWNNWAAEDVLSTASPFFCCQGKQEQQSSINNLGTPENSHWTWKSPDWKGKYSSKPSFLGSM